MSGGSTKSNAESGSEHGEFDADIPQNHGEDLNDTIDHDTSSSLQDICSILHERKSKYRSKRYNGDEKAPRGSVRFVECYPTFNREFHRPYEGSLTMFPLRKRL
jgi:hypothetical protein